jgi:hypothetical protein
MPEFILHPLIHTFGSRKDTTTCGGGSERAIVWIKVCNVNFERKGKLRAIGVIV